MHAVHADCSTLVTAKFVPSHSCRGGLGSERPRNVLSVPSQFVVFMSSGSKGLTVYVCCIFVLYARRDHLQPRYDCDRTYLWLVISKPVCCLHEQVRKVLQFTYAEILCCVLVDITSIDGIDCDRKYVWGVISKKLRPDHKLRISGVKCL